VADVLHIVHAGRVLPFDGDLEDYAQWLTEADQVTSATTQTPSADRAGADVEAPAQREAQSADARRQRKREDAARRNRLSPLKAQVTRCEQELERLARESVDVQSRLAAPDLYSDDARDALRQLLQKQTELARATQQTEAAWLE